MTKLSVEYMQDREKRFTEDQVNKAIDFVRGNGWPLGSTPPMFVWAEAFRYAEKI